MPALNALTPAVLNRFIGTPTCPVLIDICTDEDFALDPQLIPTSRRHPFKQIETLVPELQGQSVVIICQKGLKLSQGAAAMLRSHSIQADFLDGGHMAWADAGGSLIPAAKIPDTQNGSTLWVTRHRPKVDRIACPWLIRRFIDPKARFLFVQPDQVALVAEKFEATPFDIEGAALGHHNDKCSFDAFLDHFGLQTPALTHLAQIIRAADLGQLDEVPQAAGLQAASLGLSRMFKDDLEQLEAGLTLYDAFYCWARDATGETHDATSHQARQ
ncbi:chromate resistance protein ChrB domain-containing protein [Algirhabdus cladophorae]|uniref:chromate resistance protein ChrB domain-containing protein n=1 Tax=Algirhabdus cladophorae TaxID=3377108 RepID=UPI003B845F46